MSNELRQEWWSRPLGHLLWFVITLVCCTLRKKIKGDTSLLKEGQTIVALWHNRIFVPCYLYRYTIRGKVRMSMLTSASKDGTMLATVAEDYGMSAVRGSSARRGVVGFRDMVHELEQGMSMCITPDGPKGPAYCCRDGAVKLASVSGVPITPLRIRYTACFRAKSWDQFFIPLPFSRIEMEVCETIHVPAGLKEEELAEYSRKLEKTLRDEDVARFPHLNHQPSTPYEHDNH